MTMQMGAWEKIETGNDMKIHFPVHGEKSFYPPADPPGIAGNIKILISADISEPSLES